MKKHVPIDEKIKKALKLNANLYRGVGHTSKMSPERIKYLTETPRDQLSPSDKGLQTRILKYGSIARSHKNRDRSKMVWGGKMGGTAQVQKGFAKMDKQQHKLVSSKGGKNAQARSQRSRASTTRDGTPISLKINIGNK